MAKKELFLVKCSSNLHTKIEKIYVRAYSNAQAKKLAAARFNKKFNFLSWSYVDMECKPVHTSKETD